MTDNINNHLTYFNQDNFDLKKHEFLVPSKQIKKPESMTEWPSSTAYIHLTTFLESLSESVTSIKNRDNIFVSERVQKIIDLLDEMDTSINDFPPLQQQQRFGNIAFRSWFEKLEKDVKDLLEKYLNIEYHSLIPELSEYLVNSMGNSTRIDYGTGHELCFMAFVCVLACTNYVTKEDRQAIVLRVFHRYIILVRNLQTTYRMEPAGSHGAWCLDDYSFLPFYFGSSQLIAHPRLKPSVIPDADMACSFRKDFMFFDAIDYINKVKTGPFFEHSHQLWNISGVKLWSKVNTGLMKMYKAEVLSKFPVIQHFLFGSVLTLEPLDKSGDTGEGLLPKTEEGLPSKTEDCLPPKTEDCLPSKTEDCLPSKTEDCLPVN